MIVDRTVHEMCIECYEHYIEECKGLDDKQCKELCPKEE
jgi:hypothetical protein